jgi:hypothetical protein
MRIELPVVTGEKMYWVNEEGNWCWSETLTDPPTKKKGETRLRMVGVMDGGYAPSDFGLGVQLTLARMFATKEGNEEIARLADQALRRLKAENDETERFYGISPENLHAGRMALQVKITDRDRERIAKAEEKRRRQREIEEREEQARRAETERERQRRIEVMTMARLIQRSVPEGGDELSSEEQAEVDARVDALLKLR